MKWDDCKQAFHGDGSWRDIYVFNTTIVDWNNLFELVRNYPCQLRFLHDGEFRQLPINPIDVFEDTEHTHSLSIDINDITIVVHFFDIAEMEFDIDPREVTTQSQFDQFINFVIALGQKLQKNVYITEESAPSEVWFRYKFTTDKLSFELPNYVLQNGIDNSK